MLTNNFDIAILGVGGVTKSLLPQLEWLTSQTNLPKMQLAYISNRKQSLYDFENGIDPQIALQDLQKGEQAYLELSEVIERLSLSTRRAVLVDNTGTQVVADAYPKILQRGISIVTPSKKAFAGPLQLWNEIFSAASSSGATVYVESSVGAGLPMVSMLKGLIEAGDEILKIEGVLSGTLSSIFSSFAPVDGIGDSWSIAVQKAKELGFTEPDPREDLNGLDVARKLIIFARLAGLPIESAASVPIESLVPKDLESVASGAEFLKRLPEFDSEMEKLKKDNENHGKIPRYIGSIDMASVVVKVGVEMVDKAHPFANVKGSDNIISFHTRRYKSPLTLQGAGAGGDVTAMGIIRGLVKIMS